jgi:hypothetical protein
MGKKSDIEDIIFKHFIGLLAKEERKDLNV